MKNQKQHVLKLLSAWESKLVYSDAQGKLNVRKLQPWTQ